MPDIFLRCAACDRPLAALAVRQIGPAWRVKAACCYCGGASFETVVPGSFSPAGYHDGVRDRTVLGRVETDPGDPRRVTFYPRIFKCPSE